MSPGLGSAELIVALLVALAFVASAVLTGVSRHGGDADWRQRRF